MEVDATVFYKPDIKHFLVQSGDRILELECLSEGYPFAGFTKMFIALHARAEKHLVNPHN